MRNIKLWLLGSGVAALLAACGGGGGPVAISGVAATGAALASANVTGKCASGNSVAAVTGADGSFTLMLDGGQATPCMLQVSKGSVTLHSFAAQAGRLNITPVTDLVVSKALGTDPATAFAAFDADKAATIQAGLSAAKTYAAAQVASLTGSSPSGDPLTGTFFVGDANDKILDKINTALAASGKSYGDLRVSATVGGGLNTSLDRGKLDGSAVVLTTLTTSQIDAATLSSGLQVLTGLAVCDVKVVKLKYKTIGTAGEATNASGVMLVPAGTCTTPAALIGYAKGTDVQKPRTLANPADGETFLLAAMYAAQGYAVVATDYLGFADSTYAFHPYLHADSEASSVIDSVRAARNAAASVGAVLSGKVMLTGYSQGGHSSMAAHRAMERDNAAEFNLVAGAHLAGPYNLSGSFKLPDAIAGYQFFVPYLVTAWQKVYGNIYTDKNAVFKSPYAATIENLLPSATLDYNTLVTSGALPGINGETPNQARDLLFQAAFATDTQTNNKSPLYLAGKKNDMLGWSPKSKLLLCGGAGDPTVPPAVHQTVMKADFDSRKLANVESVDVDSYVQLFFGEGGKAPLPSSAKFASYYGSYHGTYEPPFCHYAARAAFAAVK